MSAVLEAIRVRHTAYDALSGLQQVRLIRQHCYSRMVLASLPELHLPKRVLDAPLPDVLGAFDRNEGGVWCGGAARILVRACLESGFRAWIYDYGAGSPVTHAVALVEVDGRVYLQDAYFNTEYVDDRGELLSFFDVLDLLRSGRSPVLRQDPGLRKGLFASDAQLLHWLPAGGDVPACERIGADRVVCWLPMTFHAFASTYVDAPKVAAWLDAAGYPRDWSFLLLHPRRGQRFLTGELRVPAALLKPDRDMALVVARAASLPSVASRRHLRTEVDSWPDATKDQDGLAARLEYLNHRVEELLEDVVRLVDQSLEVRENNRRLKLKLSGVRARLASGRSRG